MVVAVSNKYLPENSKENCGRRTLVRQSVLAIPVSDKEDRTSKNHVSTQEQPQLAELEQGKPGGEKLRRGNEITVMIADRNGNNGGDSIWLSPAAWKKLADNQYIKPTSVEW